ncbi:hypothetical protein F5Y04DRAFT_259626 [Hypomontagnella monticulosa]|nr:hypothetical protein F5Y04DRAFT_259626 [Hypomontagnella monticulosa]
MSGGGTPVLYACSSQYAMYYTWKQSLDRSFQQTAPGGNRPRGGQCGQVLSWSNVQIGGVDDYIQSNVRKGLDVITGENYRAGRAAMSRNTGRASPRKGRSTAGEKVFQGRRER